MTYFLLGDQVAHLTQVGHGPGNQANLVLLLVQLKKNVLGQGLQFFLVAPLNLLGNDGLGADQHRSQGQAEGNQVDQDQFGTET